MNYMLLQWQMRQCTKESASYPHMLGLRADGDGQLLSATTERTLHSKRAEHAVSER